MTRYNLLTELQYTEDTMTVIMRLRTEMPRYKWGIMWEINRLSNA